MNESNIMDTPKSFHQLEEKCKDIGFTMPSDIYIGTLLKSLIASKSKANVLEMGTGMSLSLAWMIEGFGAKMSRMQAILTMTDHLQREHGKSITYVRLKGKAPARSGGW